MLEKGGKYYLFVKNENSNPPEKNIRVIANSKPYGFPTNVSPPITGNYWAEGPTPLLVDEYVYVYFDKYRDKKYGAIRSKNMIDWEDVSESVSFPGGIRHGTAFTVSETVLRGIIRR
jgi:beta-galactosidase